MELDGQPASLDQVKALALTNYGHFTSMLVERGCVRGLSLHLERLRRDCRQLFDVELDVDRVRTYIRHAIGGAERTVARVTVYDPRLDLGTIGNDADPRILVTTRPAAGGDPSPWRLQAASYKRPNAAIKHVGQFGAMRHRRLAQREGYDDVLMLNADGTISEIATSNIGFVRGGGIVWPRSECLVGITMTLLNQALDEPITTERLEIADLPSMEAAFATNAATGVRPVVAINDMQWPDDHKHLRELAELYLDIPGEAL
jgi:branched-subunit amino acid aminotransferase/4-amino-4-deoxychorismate lyase